MRSGKSALPCGPGVQDSSGVHLPTSARRSIATAASYPSHEKTCCLWPELACIFYHATLIFFFFFVRRSCWFLHPPEKMEDNGGQLERMTCIPKNRPVLIPCQQIPDLPNHTCEKCHRFGQIHPTSDTSIQLHVMLTSTFIMLISSKITL